MNLLFIIFIVFIVFQIVFLVLVIQKDKVSFIQRMKKLEDLKATFLIKVKIQSDKTKLSSDLDLQIKQASSILSKKIVHLNHKVFNILYNKHI
jgi:hypothetical protein